MRTEDYKTALKHKEEAKHHDQEWVCACNCCNEYRLKVLKQDPPDKINAAEECRNNKWKVGDCLIVRFFKGPDTIKITAIGEESVLTTRKGYKEYRWRKFPYGTRLASKSPTNKPTSR